MSKIEITPELLADLKAKAEDATPGPWCTCLTAEKVLGRKHPDWGCIYANVQSSKTGEILEGCHLLRVNSNLMSEEEANKAREMFFGEGIQTNPGLMGANVEYIAAANPQVVLGLVEEIERLKEDFDTAARGEAEESVKVVWLEEEADWLAIQLAQFCSRMGSCDGCPHGASLDSNTQLCEILSFGVNCPQAWREAARKVVESEQ